MTEVTIKLVDKADGFVGVTYTFDPPIDPDSNEQLTAAMKLTRIAMLAMEAAMEGDNE